MTSSTIEAHFLHYRGQPTTRRQILGQRFVREHSDAEHHDLIYQYVTGENHIDSLFADCFDAIRDDMLDGLYDNGRELWQGHTQQLADMEDCEFYLMMCENTQNCVYARAEQMDPAFLAWVKNVCGLQCRPIIASDDNNPFVQIRYNGNYYPNVSCSYISNEADEYNHLPMPQNR